MPNLYIYTIFRLKSGFWKKAAVLSVSFSLVFSGLAPLAYAEEDPALLQPAGEVASDKESGASSAQTMTAPEPVTADASSPEMARPSYIQHPAKASGLSVEPNQAFGSLNMRYPLQLPPGRNGFTPDAGLVYSSEDRKSDSIAGFGWSLSIPYIYRANKYGVDSLYTPGKEVFASSIDGDLKPAALTDGVHGEYRAELDDGSFHVYVFNTDNTWTMRDKTGTEYRFGITQAARLNNPNIAGEPPAYKWSLEKMADTNGNTADYVYIEYAIPQKISYGANAAAGEAHIFSVEFAYESRPDVFDQYYAGFKVPSNKRISDITVKIGVQTVRAYHLGYTPGDNKARSMLASITETATDSDGISISFPPTSFTYQKSAPGWINNRDYSTAHHLLSSIMPQPVATPPNWAPYYIDINGDAYPEAFYSQQTCGSETSCNTFKGLVWNSSWRFGNPPPGYGGLQANSIPAVLYRRDAGGSWNDLGWQIVDITGDGIPEAVQSRKADDSAPLQQGAYTFNRSTLSWPAISGWNIPYPFASGREDGSTRVFDYNGDGLSDAIHATTYGGANGPAYANTGSGWVSTHSVLSEGELNFTTSFPQPVLGKDTKEDSGFRMGDANGDGLPDGVRLRPEGTNYVTVNDGARFKPGTPFVIPPKIFFSDPKIICDSSCYVNSADSGVRLFDINADGITDIVQAGRTRTPEGYYIERRVYIGQGNGWVRSPEWEASLPSSGSDLFAEFTATALRVVDINADGMQDIIGTLIPDFEKGQGYINQSKPADYLTSVVFSEGGSSSFTYKPSSHYRDAANTDNDANLLNPNLPLVVQTLEKVVTNDGLGNTDTVTYEYANGHYFFAGPHDRKFAGFRRVTETDQVRGKKTVHYFHQGDGADAASGEVADSRGRIGKEYRTETYDAASRLLAANLTAWTETNLGGGRTFTHPAKAVSFMFNPADGTHREKAASYAYDASTGNLASQTEWGEVNANPATGAFTDAGSDKRTVEYEYAAGPNNIIGMQSVKTIRDVSGAKVAESRTYYDNLALGQVQKGNATKSQDWLLAGNRYIAALRTYNPFGLVTSETNPRGASTQFIYEANNLYPSQVINDKGHANTYAYDLRTGKPVLETDPNGVQKETKYDGAGRVKSVRASAPLTGALTTLETRTYDDASMPRKTAIVSFAPSGARTSYEYYDGKGQRVQTRTQADILPSESGSYPGGKFSAETAVYDGAGRVIRQYVPFASGSASYAPTSQGDGQATVITYDTLDRPVSVQKSIGGFSKSYRLWDEITVDARGNQLTHSFDAFGNLASVTEPVGVTSYFYDALNRLVRLIDAEGNVRAIEYDSLGRVTESELPHSISASQIPAHRFEYDDAGNRTKQTYPDGRSVVWTYDSLNRPLTEDDPSVSGAEVVYTYDTLPNGIGKMASVTTKDFKRTYEYDKRGNVSKDTRTIEEAISSIPAAAPPSAPQNVEAAPLSGTEIRVIWTAPESDGGSAVTNYHVSATAGATVAIRTPDASTMLTLSGLAPDTQYTITVKAENAAGVSPASQPVAAKTNSAGTEPPPADNDIIVYDDAFRPEWTETHANLNSFNPGSSAFAGKGAKIIEANFKSSGYFRLSGTREITSADADALAFRFATPDTATMPANVYVVSYGPNSSGSTVTLQTRKLSYYIGNANAFAANTWHDFALPVSSLVGSTNKKITRIEFRVARTGKPMYFDDIRFVVPEPAQPFVIYDDALRNGWSEGTHSGITGLTLASPTAVTGTGIAFTTTKNPGQLHLKGPAVNVNDLQTIALQIRTGSSNLSATSLALWLFNGTTRIKVLALKSYFKASDLASDGKLKAHTWYPLSISAADLGLSGKNFNSFKLNVALSGAAMHLDGIQLVKKAAPGGESSSVPAFSDESTALASVSYQPRTFVTEYAYSDTGHITSVTYPDEMVASYVYGPSHQVREVYVNGAKKSEIFYGVHGKPVEIYNGVVAAFVYDPDRQYALGSRSTSDGSVNASYTYDPAGNIMRILDTGSAMPKDASFEYDAVNRLTKSTLTVSGSSGVTTFAYSPAGNITSKSDVGAYEYSDPRHPQAVTKAGSVSYAYDANGNLVSDGSAAYSYDYANRLARITNPDGATTYVYDNTANRIQKRLSNGGRVSYIGTEAEADESGKLTNYILASGHRIITLDPTEGLLYNIDDHLSSASLVYKGTSLIQKLDYDPYGTERINEKTSSFTARHTFTDKEKDTESGLHYFGARYYNPTIGRFTSVDPAVLAVGDDNTMEDSFGVNAKTYLAQPQGLNSGRTMGGSNSGFASGWSGNTQSRGNSISQAEWLADPQMQNSYAYARGNPIRFSDPTGLWYQEFLTGQQSWSSFYGEVGDAANTLGQTSPAWNFAMNHPYTTGAVVGVASAGAAQAGLYGTVALKAAAYPGVGIGYSASRVIQGTAYLYLAQDSLRGISSTLTQLNNLKNPTFGSSANLLYNAGLQGASTFGGERVGGIADTLNLLSSTLRDLSKALSSISSQSSKK